MNVDSVFSAEVVHHVRVSPASFRKTLGLQDLGKGVMKLEFLTLDFLHDYGDFVVSGQENGVAKIKTFIGLLRIYVAAAGRSHPKCLDLPESDWLSYPRLACPFRVEIDEDVTVSVGGFVSLFE